MSGPLAFPNIPDILSLPSFSDIATSIVNEVDNAHFPIAHPLNTESFPLNPNAMNALQGLSRVKTALTNPFNTPEPFFS